MEETKQKQLSKSQVNHYFRELSREHPNLESQDFETIASLISSRFEVICTKKDILVIFEEDTIPEDYELESRRIENGTINI